MVGLVSPNTMEYLIVIYCLITHSYKGHFIFGLPLFTLRLEWLCQSSAWDVYQWMTLDFLNISIFSLLIFLKSTWLLFTVWKQCVLTILITHSCCSLENTRKFVTASARIIQVIQWIVSPNIVPRRTNAYI